MYFGCIIAPNCTFTRTKRRHSVYPAIGYTFFAWLLFLILWYLSVGVLWIGRRQFEGFGYNVAFSRQYGDIALSAAVAVAAVAYRGSPQLMHYGTSDAWWHLFIGWIAVGVAIVLTIRSLRHAQVMDMYHNSIVVPIFIYLFGVIVFPATAFAGTPLVKFLVLGCVLVWAILFAIDYIQDRLDQRAWLERHGVWVPESSFE